MQNFKGDELELKMQAVANPLFDATDDALDQFYANGYDSDAFLLMLYDAQRMPFSQRINRIAFIQFIREALKNFPSIGTFESYIFILKAIFGSESDILFDVPSPGKLSIAIDAYSEITSDFLGRDSDGTFTILTSESDDLVFRGVSGIETEYEISLLFSEIMPAGIMPTFALDVFAKSIFIGYEGSDTYDMIDESGNQIIFIEAGGA